MTTTGACRECTRESFHVKLLFKERQCIEKKSEHHHHVISLKSTFLYANPRLFHIVDKLLVLVLHHLLSEKKENERKNDNDYYSCIIYPNLDMYMFTE
jgi:hypothetical protein